MKATKSILAVVGIGFHVLLLNGYAGPGPCLPSEQYPRNGDSLTIEEIKAGASEPTTKTVDSTFSLYNNTHTWNLTSDTTVKLWEGVGKWPGSFPLGETIDSPPHSGDQEITEDIAPNVRQQAQ